MEKNTKMQTLLLEDSLVNPGQLQDLKEAAKMTEISGTKWLGLLKTYGLDGSLAKMCQVLLQCQWASQEVSLTWKVSGIKPYHILFQLQPSMPNIDECDAGLWATPNTMDHLPPRSEEGTTKVMDGQRKGRTKPANLREQLDEQTMSLYKQTSSTLWPTPTHQTAGTGPMIKTLVTKEGTPAKKGERAYNPKTGKHVQLTLNRAVSLWPTPTTKGYGHASMGQTMIFRKKVEAGEMTEQQAEQMLGCTLRPPRMEKWNYPKKEMFPTPSANEDAAGRPGGKMQKMLGNHPSVRDQSSGTLNPTWVEWLMGYPIGYTDLDV